MKLISKILCNSIIFIYVVFWATHIFAQWSNLSWDNEFNSLYIKNLREVWFPVDDILEQKTISRYDITRLLNSVECIDCLNPWQNIIDKYNLDFRSNFIIRPGEDFRDITYKQANYREGSYYYCVAYAADNEYMNWYPLKTSPICEWDFCWTNTTTKAEFLQIIMNIIEQYTFQNYSINRLEVQQRKNNIQKWSYTDRYFNQDDQKIIDEWALRCWNSNCILKDRREFKTYRKYCTFELSKCNNSAYWFLKSWWWPVAEINILTKEWIINDPDIDKTIHDSIDWEYAIITLWRLFPLIQCKFNQDYDCDKVNNKDDNCPNSYNPSQKDLDNDWIGNPCDDDIDWDTIMNPSWIVDDNDSVIINKYIDGMDNCLFVINKDQADRNNDKIWDLCDWNDLYSSLWIQPIIPKTNWSLSMWFRAIHEWNPIKTVWDMWDWTFQEWESIIHTYDKPWTYTIIAKTNSILNDAIAKTTIIIWDNQNNKYWMQTTVNKLFSESINSSITVNNNTYWAESNQKIKILVNNNEDKIINKWELYNKNFTNIWSYKVTSSLMKWEDILSISQINIGIWQNNIWSSINTVKNNFNVEEEIEIKTTIEWNTNVNIIKNIERDFGDWEKVSSNSITQKKQYSNWWRYIIGQKINFEDWTTHQNYITIYIENNDIWSSTQSMYINSTPWISFWNTAILFTTETIWINEENIIKKIVDFWNKETKIIQNKEFEYEYKIPWTYYPKISYHLNECKSIYSSATVVVKPSNKCLEAKILWTLNQFKCDLDKDNIPDICDDDIDGDWKKNEIWLIKFEKDDCSIDSENIENFWLKEHIDWICYLDNCPFRSNSDQIDLNKDWIWDGCPELIPYWNNEVLSEIDTDWDGYTDDRDSCPLLPETFNNIEDLDWCPEIWNNACWWLTIPDDPFITVTNCISCPCQFADFWWTLNEWDKVRAILTNPLWNIDFTRSFIKIIQ